MRHKRRNSDSIIFSVMQSYTELKLGSEKKLSYYLFLWVWKSICYKSQFSYQTGTGMCHLSVSKDEFQQQIGVYSQQESATSVG